MKKNTLFKRAYNHCLRIVADNAIGASIGSEIALSAALEVSRTTVRAILEKLREDGIVGLDGKQKVICRQPSDHDYFPDMETESVGDLIEKKFMIWTLHGDYRPGQQINGLELARQFGVSPTAIREYLNKFSHFGLLQRRPNNSWIFLGFNDDFARELCEVRELFELRSARNFSQLPPDHPAWRRLEQIEQQHIGLLAEIDHKYSDFSDLDEKFHKLVYSVSRNRFIESFHATMSIVFHYHYLWNKIDEKERNIVAIQEHLAYISALRSRDPEACLNAARAHMRSVRTSMLKSIGSAD